MFTLQQYWICCKFWWYDIFSHEKNLHSPVTWALHWHWPVFWSQLGAPAEVLMAPTSLQLQRMQPFEFEALRSYQPGEQLSHWRPVTATLHWHWPPACRWETRTQGKKIRGYEPLKPSKRAKLKLHWLTGCFWEDLSTYDAAVDSSSNVTFAWLTHAGWCGVRSL